MFETFLSQVVPGQPDLNKSLLHGHTCPGCRNLSMLRAHTLLKTPACLHMQTLCEYSLGERSRLGSPRYLPQWCALLIWMRGIPWISGETTVPVYQLVVIQTPFSPRKITGIQGDTHISENHVIMKSVSIVHISSYIIIYTFNKVYILIYILNRQQIPIKNPFWSGQDVLRNIVITNSDGQRGCSVWPNPISQRDLATRMLQQKRQTSLWIQCWVYLLTFAVNLVFWRP